MKTSINITAGGWFASLLTVAFVVLKLCSVIEWSWIWVLAPLWIPLAIALLIVITCCIINAIEENKQYKNTLGSYGSTTHWIPEFGVLVDDTGHELGHKQEEEE